MLLTPSHQAALRALRVYRCACGTLPALRHELPKPDPTPRARWTRSALPLDALGLAAAPSEARSIDVVVPSAGNRVRASFFSCHVQPIGLPEDSFVSLGNGLCIPCPELLFLQLADIMTPEVHALLGCELCGTYSRSAKDPRVDEAAYGVPPVTSVEKITDYLGACGRRRGVTLARQSLRWVRDNAWSPMEAIVALMTCLPTSANGYGIGDVSLNVRHGTTPELVRLGCKGSRVPDIEILGTHVGFNYDSHAHLDLDSIVEAAVNGNPSEAMRSVREKYLDDLRRNRELAAVGRVILPVTPNDLFAPGGLDAVMLEAALAMEEFDDRSATHLKLCLQLRSMALRRQRLIWSLLPWPAGRQYARELLESVPWEAVLDRA